MFVDPQKKIRWKAFVLTAAWIITARSGVQAASPKGDVREGNALYFKGEFEASLKKYQEALKKVPESDIVNFGIGTVFYKGGDYRRAEQYLQKALLSEDEAIRAKAYYNLGNAFYQSGVADENKDIDASVLSLEKALAQYERVLSMDKEDEDAAYNHAFVKKELERLKEKQKQDQQKNKPDKSDSSDKRGRGRSSKNSENQDDQEDFAPENQNDQTPQGQDEQPPADQKGWQENQGLPDGKEGPGDQPPQGQEGSDKGQGRSGGKDDPLGPASDVSPRGDQALTEEEARRILENYQQTQEPHGLMKFYLKNQSPSPALKDW